MLWSIWSSYNRIKKIRSNHFCLHNILTFFLNLALPEFMYMGISFTERRSFANIHYVKSRKIFRNLILFCCITFKLLWLYNCYTIVMQRQNSELRVYFVSQCALFTLPQLLFCSFFRKWKIRYVFLQKRKLC